MYSPASLLLAPAAALALYVWRRRYRHIAHIPGPPSASWMTGSLGEMFFWNSWSFHSYISETFGGIARYAALFSNQELWVVDPLAMYYILVKEQQNYEEDSLFLLTNHLVFGAGLLATAGSRHSRQRKILNPVFNIKHMRGILPIFYPITKEIRDVMARLVKDGPQEIDVMKYLSEAALEYLGRGGLGHSFGTIGSDKTTTHSEAVKSVSSAIFRASFLIRTLMPYIRDIGSVSFRRKAVEWVAPYLPQVRDLLELSDTLHREATSVVEEKRRALQNGDEGVKNLVSQGKDILSIILKTNQEAKEEDRLTDEEIVGQVNTFIFAGQDTTSHMLCRIFHLLAQHPDVQEKLRQEILEALEANGGREFEYDELMALPYLDAVCRESLRMYPPIMNMTREAQGDAVLPLLWPVTATDGKTQVKEVIVKKGQRISCSIWGANRSKKIWGEDANEWRPERWLKPLPTSVSDAKVPGVYSSIMTFLAGGRSCIGFKFSEMEMKLVLSCLLEKLVFEGGEKIVWEVSTITRPTVHGADSDKKTKLPLRVSLYSP